MGTFIRPHVIGLLAAFAMVRGASAQSQAADKHRYEIEFERWAANGQHEADDTVGVALLNELAVVYMMKGALARSDRFAAQAITLSEVQLRKGPVGDARVRVLGEQFNAMGLHAMYLSHIGMYDEAIVVCRAQLKTVKALGSGHEELEMQVFDQLVRLSSDLGDYDSALGWSDSALHVVDTTDHIALAQWHLSHGIALHRSGRMDSAKTHLNQTLALNDPAVARINHADAHQRLWEIHVQQREMTEAATQLASYKAMIGEEHTPLDRSNLSYMEGRMLYEKGALREALPRLLMADSLANTLASPKGRTNPLKYLALCYAGLGDRSEAGEALSKYREALRQELDPRAIRDLATHRAGMLHEKELDLEQSKAGEERRKRLFAWWIAGGSLLMCGVILISILAVRARNRVLQAKNMEILRTRDDLVRSERMREASELRSRIARDLHDEIGGELTGLTVLGNELTRSATAEPSAVPAIAERLRTLTRQMGAAMNDVVWAVDPARDNVSSLLEHVERYVHRISADTAKTIRTAFSMDRDAALPVEVKHNVFMVMKEALNNALKYAGASTLGIDLTVQQGRYHLRVVDNGKGFNPIVEAKSGNGLRNMKARAEQLGAKLEVITATGQGTEIRLSGDLSYRIASPSLEP